MGWHASCVLVLLLASSKPWRVAGARACEESGYCSTGISQHWVGDIKQSVQLKAMLEAVTYKKELVITIFQESDGNELWVDQALQLHWELEDMGYAHHLFITDGTISCDRLNKNEKISCVWDSSDLSSTGLGGEVALWHNRWKMIARASRIGYNIMSIDTDFMWFRDPYVHFKADPFNKLQLLAVPEGGSVFNNNGGFIYVQNARPDGPVSWVFKQVVMSTLRRSDDNMAYIKQWRGNGYNCLTFDQSIIFDALVAAAVGRPLFPNALGSCKQAAEFTTRAGTNISTEAASKNINHLVAQHIRTNVQIVRPAQSFLDSIKVKEVPDFDSHLQGGNLTVPNLNWGYPEELGGRFAPTQPGQTSAAFTQQLKEDCPDCPWWPERRPLPPGEDPIVQMLGPAYDGNTARIIKENANAFWSEGVPQESWAQVPTWLACSLGHVRRGWVLGKNAPIQGPMVLGHVHAWHMQTARAHKAMIRKVLGRYNWTLGSRVAYLAGLPNPYGLGKEVKRVLALSPNVDLSRTRSWQELSSIIVGLIQVASLSNRIMLMPNLPCHTAWLHDAHWLMDPSVAVKMCVAPTFWRDPYKFPLPVTVAVDERGELIGGWARRLRATYGSASIQQPVIPPMVLRPDEPDGEHRSSSGSGGWTGGPRRGLTADVPDDWWQKQRYMAVLPQLWDPSCTKGFKAIVGPEFFHWLKNDETGKTVDSSLKLTSANTVFTPSPAAENLKLRPLQMPDAGVLPARVQPTITEKGWSLYDVQAALPVAEVIARMKLADSQPLVYVDHPVMVVHSTTDTALQATLAAQDAAKAMPTRIQEGITANRELPQAEMTPDEAMSVTNIRIAGGKCKAAWVLPETHDGQLVDLTHGQPSVLVGGLITPAPQQATQ